jgi:TonB family protein
MSIIKYFTTILAFCFVCTPTAHADGRNDTYIIEKPSDGDSTPPDPIHPVPPQYPEDAVEAELEGDVVMEFTISATGTVQDATVVRSTNPIFEEVALDALAQWKYRATIKDGEPTEYTGMRVMLCFHLAKMEED